MVTWIKRVVVRKKGMEALQAVLLLAAAFVIVGLLKQLGGEAKEAAKTELSSSMGGTGSTK